MIPYEKVLEKLMADDPNIMVMTAENRALLRNLPAKIGDRFIDTGITEQTMIGMGAGLAVRGRKPVVHALAAFLTMRAFEFIRTDVGIPNLPVKLMGFVPGLLSDGNGPTHQAIEDVAIMRGIPKMQVFCPADEQELLEFMPEIIGNDQPAYVRLNMRKAETERPTKGGSLQDIDIYGDPQDLLLLSYGYLFWETYQAFKTLQGRGVKVGLANIRSMEPLNEDQLLPLVEKTKHIATVEDHFLRGGLATATYEFLGKRQLQKPVTNFGFAEKWYRPGRLNDVLSNEGLHANQIAEELWAKVQ